MKLNFNQKLIGINLAVYLLAMAVFLYSKFVAFLHIDDGFLGLFPYFKYVINPVPYFSVPYTYVVFVVTTVFAVQFLINRAILRRESTALRSNNVFDLFPPIKNKIIFTNILVAMAWTVACFILGSTESGVGGIFVSFWIAAALLGIQFMLNLLLAVLVFVYGLIRSKDTSRLTVIFLCCAFFSYLIPFIGYIIANVAINVAMR